MNIESIPKFTDPAAKWWASIPTETKKLLLSNVWCGKCHHEVTITNFTGAVKAATCCWSVYVRNAMVMWRE
ncbi:MAG TPA: hypothetical protein VFW43_09095 [Polaromonas sp.]|nr:hypothetical protein [Polaromonas sp.]